MTELFLILISTVFINNLILEYALGTDSAADFSRRMDVAYGFSKAILILLPLCTLLAWCFQHYLLEPYNLEYAQTFLFAISILFAMTVLKSTMPRFVPSLARTTDIFYPIAGLNTLVLGSMLLSLQETNNIIEALVFGFGSALSFSLVLILITAMRSRLETADTPQAFRGTAITLLSLGILSMAFMGFSGMGNI